MNPAKIELTILMGTNQEKLDLCYQYSKEQTVKVLQDFLTRPNKFLYCDFKGEDRRQKKGVTGEDIALQILNSQKFPAKVSLDLVKYLFEFERWGFPLGSETIRQLNKFPTAEEYVYKHLAERLNQLDRTWYYSKIIEGLRTHNQNFYKYKEFFFVKLKQTASLKGLQIVAAQVFNFVGENSREKMYKEIRVLLQEKIKGIQTKELLSYHKNNSFISRYLFEDSASYLTETLGDLIKEELPRREHVLKSSQSKLIRKMSIHAGEKLTLRQAQLLANKLSNKK